jgi:predicted permease
MRSALRSLWRRPAFSIAAILTVALGIGANAALFGVIDSVLLRPLPFRDPSRLVQIWQTHPALPQLQVTVPDFQDWRDHAHSFDVIAAYTLSAMNTVTLLGQGEPAIVHGTMASRDLFSTMGIQPIAGRIFGPSEEQGRQQVALISENLWRRKFAADPAAIGRQIRLGTQSFRVIGVVSQRQAFPEWADLWMPLSLIEPELRDRRKYHPLETVARLKPGVSLEQAQTEIRTIAARLSRDHPDTNAMVGAYVISLTQELTGSVRPALLLAWAAVGLVLLIACANLAHLFLARIIDRRQEMVIREALGAGKWDLIRQLLGESLLIAAIGGAAGVVLAVWAAHLARTLAAGRIPRIEEMAFDGPIWLFAAGMSLVAGVLFGLPAVWHAMRSRTQLRAGGRSIVRGRSRFSSVLMAGEVAMALLVLSGAALLTRSFAALLREDPGFEAKQVWTVPKLPVRSDFGESEVFLRTRLLPALRATPGVVDVAAVNSAPMSLGETEHSRFATRFGVEGKTYDSGSYPVAQNRWITPEFFGVLGVGLKHGRLLSEPDRDQPRIVVNETLARRFFRGGDAVGKRLALGVMDPKPELLEIVGVVGDIRDFGLDQEVEPTMYSIAAGPVMTLLVKSAASSGQIAAAIRDTIGRVDSELPVTTVQPLQQNVADSLAKRRFALILLAVFGGLAAFLTAGGMYGLLTQSVNARTREFGVRAAVGASPRELLWMVLRESAALTVPGLVVGTALSLAFASGMRSLVYRLSLADPISIAAAAIFLALLTIVSTWLPARRAAKADAAAALRSE